VESAIETVMEAEEAVRTLADWRLEIGDWRLEIGD
jgi:hypothetical protein